MELTKERREELEAILLKHLRASYRDTQNTKLNHYLSGQLKCAVIEAMHSVSTPEPEKKQVEVRMPLYTRTSVDENNWCVRASPESRQELMDRFNIDPLNGKYYGYRKGLFSGSMEPFAPVITFSQFLTLTKTIAK